VVTVEDNGIGFEQKYAERVFSAFERLHGRSDTTAPASDYRSPARSLASPRRHNRTSTPGQDRRSRSRCPASENGAQAEKGDT